MLSYQWDAQAVIERLNISLQCRGYLTWFDLTNMKGARLADNPVRLVRRSSRLAAKPGVCMTRIAGSTMDAMSDAIEGADVMLYGVSLQYKESANCRLEANYAHQQELDMIPLMMQESYKPQGWRKSQH